MSYPNYIWWVIPKKLAGMPRPPLEDLKKLKEAGLGGIVSLLNDSSLIQKYEQAHLQALSLPIVEDLAPTISQVKEFVNFTDKIISRNQAVAVHCTGGNHRTGTLLASYFVSQGEPPQSVIQGIQQIRPTAQLSQQQTQWLVQLPQLLSN